jgi:hypothetical protein
MKYLATLRRQRRQRLESQIPSNLRPQNRQLIRHTLDIFITTSTQTYNNILSLLHCLRQLQRTVHSMRSLQRRDNALQLTDQLESNERFCIRGGNELGALVVFPRRQFGADTRVVQPCRHRVRVFDLAMLVLQDVGADTVQNAFRATD